MTENELPARVVDTNPITFKRELDSFLVNKCRSKKFWGNETKLIIYNKTNTGIMGEWPPSVLITCIVENQEWNLIFNTGVVVRYTESLK